MQQKKLNKKKLDIQTGLRVMERLVIQWAYDFVKQEDIANKCQRAGVCNSSKGTYCLLCDTNTNAANVDVSFDWKNDQFNGLEPLHQDHIVQVLITQLLEEYALPDANTEGGLVLEIPFFTEYEQNGFVNRGHQNCRGLGAYNNGAKVCWEDGQDAISGR
jgi:hypothetical protein